jgi:carbonic anhydrase
MRVTVFVFYAGNMDNTARRIVEAHQSPGGDNPLTPQEALQKLVDGHERYLNNCPLHPNAGAERRTETAANGQKPFCSILSCSDSRVPVELIFDAGIGDLFVVRVPGNVCRSDQLGALEYGIVHLKTPLCVVLGHTKCGAVTAVVNNIAPGGALGKLLTGLAPAVEWARQEYADAPVEHVVEAAALGNVLLAMSQLPAESVAIDERLKSGHLEIMGAIYDVTTGSVTWVND